MHLQKERIAQGRLFRPGIVQFGKAVGIVGEDGGAAQDERAFAAQCIVHRGQGKNPRHQEARFLVTLADCKRPRGGQQQARAAVELVRRQDREPILDDALPPVNHERFVEAALRQRVSLIVRPDARAWVAAASMKP